jgi:hypothetical protein
MRTNDVQCVLLKDIHYGAANRATLTVAVRLSFAGDNIHSTHGLPNGE